MADDENRSKLFDEIRNFSQRKLKKVETKVVTGSGEQLTEKRSPKGLQQVKSHGITSPGYVADTKPDLQVGMIIPGLFISSQDVAQDKSLLETYEITHILNLAPGVENAFEDDYNYKKIEILDLPETDITQYFDECIEFIHEGIQRGNCLVHCNAGVSRSTTLCCAYLMKQKKMKYKEALASIREARAFAKPNEGFAKQLEQYDDQLFGQMAPPDSSEDKFMARKRAEIEAEKAAILGRSSVKNTLKSFGAHLDSVIGQKLQSITPIKLPVKKKPAANPAPAAQTKNNNKLLTNNVAVPPPPPPPPGNILDKKSGPAPPPPPPLPSNNNIFEDKQKKSPANKVNAKTSSKVKPAANAKSSPQINNVNNQEINNERQSKSEFVDETPIKVSAQKKLWETANNQQKQEKPEKISTKKKNIATTPVAQQPTNIVKSNKIGTWERAAPAPEPNRTLTASPVTSSPEPKKKIIIKKKDANNNVIGSNEPRRSTRDLAAALEAAASESNSSTPYSSPGPQRRQMQYGKRASTQTIPNDPNKSATARKPMWGLRDQVDNLMESTPTSTPTRCRSPALIQTQQQRDFSHSPSPQPGANAGQKSNKMVFGRVPPRKTSLSGAGNMVESNINDSNDLPVVCAPITTTTNDTSKKTSNKLKTKEPELSSTTNKTTTNNNNNNNCKNNNIQPTKATCNNVFKKSENKNNDSTKANTDDAVRSGFKKVPLSETKDSGPSSTNTKDNKEIVPKEKSTNQSIEARRKSRGLNRSSTAKILNLIKTKSKADFGKSIETVDEDVEIEFLLNQLDETGLENIDWDEIGIDENEIKEIVDKNQDEDESGSDEESEETETETSEEESDEDDSDDEMEHTVFKPIAPASNLSTVDNKTKPINNLIQPKITSTATLTLKPVDKSANKFVVNNTKLEVDESEETESD